MAAVFVLAAFAGVNAQKGNNKIGVGLDLGMPMGDFGDASKMGIGGYVKGLYGVGQSGHLTFTTGYQTFKAKNLAAGESSTTSLIPLLAGYSHSFSGFYVEPQLGYSISRNKYSLQGTSGSNSSGSFTWAAGMGYAVNGFDIGLRYQSMANDGSTASFLGLRAGYHFMLGKK